MLEKKNKKKKDTCKMNEKQRGKWKPGECHGGVQRQRAEKMKKI